MPCWSILLAAYLFVASPAKAQHVSLNVSADSVSIGERFSLTITAEHDGTVTPVFPDPTRSDSTLGDILLLRRLNTGVNTTPDGLRRDSAIYEVTTFALDTALVAPFPLQFTTDGGTLTAQTPPLAIPVRSVVPEDAQDIRDLAPLVEFNRPWWFWALILLAVLAAIAFAWYLWYRYKTGKPAESLAIPTRHVSPYEEAVERLQRLQETDLGQPNQVKPYYVELSDTVRTYLARQFGIPALEQTSRELISEITRRSQQERFPPDAVGHITHVLEVADLVKFADMYPDPSTSRSILDETFATIQGIESVLHPAPATDEPAEQPA